MAGQPNWRWCYKCQGMFLGPGASGACPAGGTHDPSKSANYTFGDLIGPWFTGRWARCNRCQGLFNIDNNTTGTCPATGGGGHDWSGSSFPPGPSLPSAPSCNVSHEGNSAAQQGGWRWCNKCEGLFYSGGYTSGNCPAGGGHDSSGSDKLAVTMN
jgi:hypothetical protein